jgi:hypothetical protein
MPDALRRAIRTFAQAFVGVLLLQAAAIAVSVNQGTWVPDVDWLKRVVLSAAAAGVIAVLSWLQNYLEDSGVAGKTIPAVLKAPASSGENPAPSDAGTIR